MPRLPLALLALLALPRDAAAEVELRQLPSEQLVALAPALRQGDLALIESHANGQLRQITLVTLVAAPAALVHEIVTNPERWPEFARNLVDGKVWRQSAALIDYEFTLDLKVARLSVTHRMQDRGDGLIDMASRLGQDETRYRWHLVAAPGGTVVALYGYSDLAHHPTLHQVVAAAPTMEHGLALSTELYYARTVRRRAEQLAKPGSFPAANPKAKPPSLLPLMDRGTVVIVRTTAAGRAAELAILERFRAPPRRVEEVLLKPADYPQIIDGVRRTVELERGKDHVIYESEFDLSLLSFLSRYSARRVPGAVDVLGLSGDFRDARHRWDLTAQGAAGTMVVLRSSQDLTRASPLVLGTVIRQEPLFEAGINVALAMVQVAGVRARAEGRK